MRTVFVALIVLTVWSALVVVVFGSDFAQPASAEDSGANSAMASIRAVAAAIWAVGVIVIGASGWLAIRWMRR
jgi:hypothetical protein